MREGKRRGWERQAKKGEGRNGKAGDRGIERGVRGRARGTWREREGKMGGSKRQPSVREDGERRRWKGVMSTEERSGER